MEIGLLSEKYTPDIGGLAISAGRLAGSLASAGHTVRVFAPTESLSPSEERTQRSGRVSVTRFGVHKRTDDTLVDWFELIVREHQRRAFDVLHAYFLTQAGWVAAYAGKYLNIPSVVSLRGNDIERAMFDPGRFSHALYALQNAGAVTANTHTLARKGQALFEREIDVIPNGIDARHFLPRPRNERLARALGMEVGLPVLGFVGELREKKGLGVLFSGYTQLCAERPSILLLVGEVRPGTDRHNFAALQRSISNSQIVVTGYVPHRDLPEYYALMDVFLHPSLRDGMPNALLEAMACEKAVIATAVGGIKEVVDDGKNGLLVDARDAEALARATLTLLASEEQRKALGQNARRTVLSRFTPQAELEGNLAVYRRLGLNTTISE